MAAAAVSTNVDLILPEMNGGISGRIGGEDRENNFSVFVAGQRTHQENVWLAVAVLGVINSLGFFLELVTETVLGGQGEAIGQHHHRSHV